MTITLEVCIDNYESLVTANAAEAGRIELCSSLDLGGLTPSIGFAEMAVKESNIPIYAIIRPRAGDFVFSEKEIEIMLLDITKFKEAGIDGVVVGALNSDGSINLPALKQMVTAAQGMGVTFHRAFDLVSNPLESLELLIEYGCERVLTSGQKDTAMNGVELIKQLNTHAKKLISQRNKLHQTDLSTFSIMAGAGVSPDNAKTIIEHSGITEIHMSGKTTRPSQMASNSGVTMGSDAESDNLISVAGFDNIKRVVALF